MTTTTTRKPFTPENMQKAKLMQLVAAMPPARQRALERLILACLEKDPEAIGALDSESQERMGAYFLELERRVIEEDRAA